MIMGEFIVIEKHGGWQYATPVTDEEGNNKIFTEFEQAQEEADKCQDGIVVGDGVMSETEASAVGLINDAIAFIISTKGKVTFGTEQEAGYYMDRKNKLLNRLKQWQKSIQI